MDELKLPKCLNTGVILYSAVFGRYDKINVAPKCEDVDAFILFTDDEKVKVEGWEVIKIHHSQFNPKFLNRIYKIRPDYFIPNAKITIYIDGNIKIREGTVELLMQFFREKRLELMNMKHFARDCIYDEAETLLRSTRVESFSLLREVLFCYRNGFRKQVKMGENNILLRTSNCASMVSELWWQLYSGGCGRDQISLPLVIKEKNIRYMCFPKNVRECNNFEYFPHTNEQGRNPLQSAVRYIFLVIPYKLIRTCLRF